MFEFLKKYCWTVLNIFRLKKHYQYQYQYLLVKVWAIPVPIQKKFCQYFIIHTFFIPFNNTVWLFDLCTSVHFEKALIWTYWISNRKGHKTKHLELNSEHLNSSIKIRSCWFSKLSYLFIYGNCDSGKMVKKKVNSGFMPGWIILYIAHGLSNKLLWCLNYQKNMFC